MSRTQSQSSRGLTAGSNSIINNKNTRFPAFAGNDGEQLRSYFIAATYSLIIHMLVILLLFGCIKTANPKQVGYKNVVQAYVITEPVIIAKHESSMHHTSENKNAIRAHSVIPAQSGIQKFQKLLDPRVREDDYFQKQKGNPNHLLIILHNQIQQQINNSNYNLPESLNKRSADVQFLLSPNGEVSNVNIIESSGVTFLDNLALRAVQAIEPCVEAKKYLAASSYFRIKVYYNPH
jgi:TonB family protein